MTNSYSTFTPSRRTASESATLKLGANSRQLNIEWATFEGSGAAERWNEDSLLVAAEQDKVLLAVFDGVTPIPTSKVKNGGHVASKAAVDGVLAAFRVEVTDPRTLLLAANAAIRQVSQENGVTPGDPLDSLATTGTLVCIDLAAGTLSFASISDSMLVLKRRNAPAERVTFNNMTKFDSGSIALMQGVSGQVSSDPESALWQRILRNRQFQNAPEHGGYGVLNGMADDLVQQYIEGGEVSLAEVERFILLTDGAELHEQGEGPDQWGQYDEAVFQRGGVAFLEHVRALEEQDQNRERFPRIKLHNDSTIIAVRVDKSGG